MIPGTISSSIAKPIAMLLNIPITIIGSSIDSPTASDCPIPGVSPDRCITVARVSAAWSTALVTMPTSNAPSSGDQKPQVRNISGSGLPPRASPNCVCQYSNTAEGTPDRISDSPKNSAALAPIVWNAREITREISKLPAPAGLLAILPSLCLGGQKCTKAGGVSSPALSSAAGLD
ncbi:MAG: hypothetical protein WDN24_01900 [Sphingomonas sp.]